MKSDSIITWAFVNMCLQCTLENLLLFEMLQTQVVFIEGEAVIILNANVIY